MNSFLKRELSRGNKVASLLLAALLLATQPVAATGQESGKGSTLPSTKNTGPARLNNYRSLVSSPAVIEDSKRSEGAFAHARYLVKNYSREIRSGTLGANASTEDSTNRWYSREGHAAAHIGSIAYPLATVADKQSWAIDKWMTDPIQRLQLLGPQPRLVGYGEYCENGVCVAVLTTSISFVSWIEQMKQRARPLAFDKLSRSPIKFPPNRATVALRELSSDRNSALAACPEYKAPTGLPITLQFPGMIDTNLSAYSVTKNGKPIQACGFGATSYTNGDPKMQNDVRSLLKAYGAVVIIPREPLLPGATYAISAKVNGRRFAWSFKVK